MYTVETTTDGFVALGQNHGINPDRDDRRTFLLFSENGSDWTLSRPGIDFTDITTLNNELIAVDGYGNIFVWDGQQPPD